MSARFLTAYLVSVAVLAGVLSQALAKPPDLPAKVQINCEKSSDKLMLKTYQVADLVISVPGLPEGLPWAEVALPMPAAFAPPPVQLGAIAPPLPASPILVPPTLEPARYVQQPIYSVPQPSDLVTLPVPPPMVAAHVPGMPAVYEVVKAKGCCPACPSGKCVDCPAYCQSPACVAAGCMPPQAHAPQKTLEDRLIRLIVSTVKPESWDVNGGRGTIDFFPLGMALTVNQTPEIQEQVAQLLAGLRRLQDEQITVEVRVISVPQGFGEKVACKVASGTEKCGSFCNTIVITAKEMETGSVVLGEAINSDSGLSGSVCEDCPGCCSKKAQGSKDDARRTYLSDAQVQKLMDCLQSNPKTNVMMTPKVSVFSGQPATVNINEQHFFVTNVKFACQDGQPIFFPENHPFSTGFMFSVKPTVSADHKFIQMSLEAEERNLDVAPDHVPLFPVTSFITPLFEGGAKGEPVPFTMFLQQPAISIQRVHQEVCVPCGQTFLFKGWTTCKEVSEESAIPVLSSLPYIGDMFKNVTYHQETADVWVMVTPRLIVNQEEEKHAVASAEAPATVTYNLQKLDQARKLMNQADFYRRAGQKGPARYYYEMVQQLCPGSRYAQLAERRLDHLSDKQAARAPELVRPNPSPMPVSDQREEVLTIKNGKVIKTRVFVNGPELKTDPKVSEYLTNYWQACAEGRLSEATQWAVQALALDPACFSRVRNAGGKNLAPPMVIIPSAN